MLRDLCRKSAVVLDDLDESGGDLHPTIASAVEDILDEIWHREDDSDVRGAAVELYDALFDACPAVVTDELRRQRDTLAEECQNELQVRHERNVPSEDI
jgi:hypothetical protein